MHYTESRNRTGTKTTLRRILSPVRLPIPPPRLKITEQYINNLSESYNYMLTVILSGRRGSNPRPPPWQGGVLPLNYFRIFIQFLCRLKDSNLRPPVYKTDALPTELNRHGTGGGT